jgi:hypothetical protein
MANRVVDDFLMFLALDFNGCETFGAKAGKVFGP